MTCANSQSNKGGQTSVGCQPDKHGMNYPCTAAEAVARGIKTLRTNGGEYQYGQGNYQPGPYQLPLTNGDVPWTGRPPGSDCAGFAISYCWKLVRHRPGFNVGPWASVADDINVNSAIEDARHKQELFTIPADVKPGDLLCYPTFWFHREWIGHVGLVEEVPSDYRIGEGWHRLTILQCHGPNGFKPGVVRSDGAIWDHHDHIWPVVFTNDRGESVDPRSCIVRPRERA